MSIELLDTLIDQLDNQFDFIFPNGIPGDDGRSNKELSIRIEGSFSFPKQSIEVYKLPFQGTYISKPKPNDTSEKAFTVTFTIGMDWQIYKSLEYWFKGVFNNQTATKVADTLLTTEVKILALNGNDKINQIITYKGVFITGIQISEMNHQTGEPLKVTCDFAFSDMVVSDS